MTNKSAYKIKKSTPAVIRAIAIVIFFVLMQDYFPKQGYDTSDYIKWFGLILFGAGLVWFEPKINRKLGFLLIYILYLLLISLVVFKTYNFLAITILLFLSINDKKIMDSLYNLKNKVKR